MNAKPGHRRGRSQLVALGRPKGGNPHTVNVPVSRASTYLYESVASMRRDEALRAAGERTSVYGRRGTDTSFALEDALVALEQGFGARLTASGLSANALVFLAVLGQGDHVLISESVYDPLRRFADGALARYGIAHDYIVADAGDLEQKIRKNTKLVYLESPGSSLFEIIDLPRICGLAHANGSLVAVDNTWGSAWAYNPLALDADISVISATKYLSGHSDVILGAVVANEAAWPSINRMAELLGTAASPDDAYLVLRGMRTLAVRMAEHEAQARRLIDWFSTRPEVARMFYPALAEHPGHDLWQRDFHGAGGLFSVELNMTADRAEAFVDRLLLFGRGSSWGGYESLARIERPARQISGSPKGPVIRFYAGLEDARDLIEDLERAFGTSAGEGA